MTRQGDLKRLRAVQAVQQVERDLAARAHGEACAHADVCDEAVERARREAGMAADQWYRAQAGGWFDPEHAAALAAGLLAAEENVLQRVAAAEVAIGAREERAEAWRLSEARRRAGERVMRDMRRDCARRSDDSALDVILIRTARGERA